jgi:penicillin-binding protein 1A
MSSSPRKPGGKPASNASPGRPKRSAASTGKAVATRGRKPAGSGAKTRGPASRKTGRRRAGGSHRAAWPWRVAKWTAVAAVWMVILGIFGLIWIAWDLPDIDSLAPGETTTRRQAVTVLAEDGSTLAAYGDLWGQRLAVGELPKHLSQAVMAIEDRRFYDHAGVDPRGIARAAVANLLAGRVSQGGSTLTQQLAKNLFLTPERSLERKLKELVLAFRLEQRLSKDEILTIYLNRVYLGAGSYGVEAASQRYFGHSARTLDLYQAALLAGLLKAPSRYNPRRDVAAARTRTRIVLDAMVDAGFVDQATADRARRQGEAAGFAAARVQGGGARYFTDWALERASGYAGATGDDLIVSTTLDPRLQAAAQAVADKAAAAGVQFALVAMTPQGAVRALIGGADYGESQFNRATQALRQPGSAFKPFVYLPALEAGMTPDTMIADAPVTVEGWSPENFSRNYRGAVTLRTAMAQSINTVAVRLAEDVGRDRVLRAARRLGIASDLTALPSLALGTGEVTLLDLTAAYAVFANGGTGVVPYGVRAIRAGGRPFYEAASVSGTGRVIEPGIAGEMTDLLTAVVRDGTGRAAQLDRPAAGKTGTSQDYRDALFVGYTAELVTGVWIGHDDNAPLRIDGKPVTGGALPARLWHDFMMNALKGIPARALVVEQRIATPSAPPTPSSAEPVLRDPTFDRGIND